jgi:hypothetical protein
MNGDLLYELAKQRNAELRRAGEAHQRRAAARGRRSRDDAPQAIVAPEIPDFADEMFDGARDLVPPPRQETGRGRHARTSR